MINFKKDIFIPELKNRDPVGDLSKGFAVIVMIQVHILELFIVDTFFGSLPGKIFLFLGGPPAAPVFMSVMGYYLAKSNKTQSQLLIRGILLFFGGLLLNIGLNLNLLMSIAKGEINLNPYNYIFGADILLLAGLSVIIISFVKRFCKTMIIITFLTFSIPILAQILPEVYLPVNGFPQYIVAFFWGNYDWSYFPIFPWLAYPFLGYIFYLFSSKYNLQFQSKFVKYLALAALFFVLVITFEYALNIASDLKSYYHHDILFFIWVTLFLVFFLWIIIKIDKYFGGGFILLYIKWLGKNVTGIYVFQWLLIGNIATEIYKTQNEEYFLFWFLGILLTSSLLVFGWEKLRKFRSIRY